jgi:radical SAM protein with 4Fe4S-binding SPASM domain
MLETTEKLLNNGSYDSIHFRLSGGEPFMVFNNYKDIVTEYKKKYPKQMNFGILSNFVKFNDEIADWMELNNIGMQVSLDDLVNGKPLANGESSSERVLQNIQKLQTRNIRFSLNTVLDIEKTKDLTKLANFVSTFKNIEWGLNASYTESDQTKIDEVIKIFDDCIFQLVKRGFDINHKLRFYNTVVGNNRGGCSAGINSFGIGTNLEVWSCQSLCDKERLGYFDENIKETLMTSPLNEYFRKRGLRPECSDCPVLGQCRGGCRSTHESDEINDVVCQI